MALDPGTMDYWIASRLFFWTATPATGDTGDFDKWIAERIYWHDYVEAAPPAEVRQPRPPAAYFDGPTIF